MAQTTLPRSAVADWLFVRGRILTLDPRRPRAEWLAVAGERVLAVGTGRPPRALRGPRTRQVDLDGAPVIPGLVDAHAHLDREGLKHLYPSLATCRSIAEIQALLRRLAATRPPGAWIVTMPLGRPPFYLDVPACLREKRLPTRDDLDAAAPDHPVYVRGIWGYWNRPPIFSVANSAALRLAGITREAVPPRGVEIARDGTGEPTGVFVEHNAIPVLEFTLMHVAPRFTHADRLRALRDAQRRYHAHGVTAVCEGHGVAPEVLRVYRELHARNGLTVRAHLAVSPTWRSPEEAERALPDLAAWAGGAGVGDARLRVEGIYLAFGGNPEVSRILVDGQPYTGWAGFVEQAHDEPTYRALVRLAGEHGLRVNTIVTRSLPGVLAAWEAVDRRTRLRGRRWALVHLNGANPADLHRIGRLGAVVTTNPISYLHRSGAAEVTAGIPPEELLPHRALLRARIPFALGTDNKPAEPFLAIWSAVAREDLATRAALGPAERLTPAEALRAMTRGGAILLRREHELGALAPGRLADLVVLDADPLAVPPAALASIRARLTMVGGRPVFRHDAPTGAEP